MKDKFTKLKNVYKKYGFIGFCKKLKAYIIANYLDKISFKTLLFYKKYQKQIRKILETEKYDRVVLWRSSFGYNVPLFQRPQHIANNLSKNKCLLFYEVTTMTDKVKTYSKLNKNFYLINYNNKLMNKILMKELGKVTKPKYVQLYSTDWKLSVQNIKDYITKGYNFIYEYIDHISAELAGTKDIPLNIVQKYEYVMGNDNTYVITTADKLSEDVIKKRGKKNLAISSNGVDYNYFSDTSQNFELDDDFKNVLSKNKPVVMYYGALATWFDYELVKKIAKTNKYSVVLFGIKYDESFDKNIDGEENIYFLGQRDYKVLKYYAAKADVLTIPFVINDITRATSPVKIYEYMSVHKPIVTTDMNECRKYKSVLIGHDHKEFISLLDEALNRKNDKKYINLLDKEARNNDWSKKAEDIIKLISKDEK